MCVVNALLFFQWGLAINVPPLRVCQETCALGSKEKYICHRNDSHSLQSHFYLVAVELALSLLGKIMNIRGSVYKYAPFADFSHHPAIFQQDSFLGNCPRLKDDKMWYPERCLGLCFFNWVIVHRFWKAIFLYPSRPRCWSGRRLPG